MTLKNGEHGCVYHGNGDTKLILTTKKWHLVIRKYGYQLKNVITRVLVMMPIMP